MKKNRKAISTSPKFLSGEHVRVVPLFHPKPSVTIEDLGRARGKRDEGDLFDGKPHGIPASAKLTYRGGSLIPNVEVFTVFWGKLWSKSKTSIKMMADLNKFFTVILTSPAIDQLAEYSVPKKQTIGHGSLIGTKAITANAPVGSVTDSTIQTQLKAWIAAKTLPPTHEEHALLHLSRSRDRIDHGREPILQELLWLS